MQFDDRLATVLRTRAESEAVLRIQFRQLLDLLGTARNDSDSELRDQAYARLGELTEKLPQEDQSRILREPGVRLRNPQLVAFLAEGDSKPSAAVMATARLTEKQWLDLIPHLPVTARGFLRHRRDLSSGVREVLARLGVGDLVLPQPGASAIAASLAEAAAKMPPAPATPSPTATGLDDGIGALLKRIEAFREGRRTQTAAPRPPYGEDHGVQRSGSIDFACNASGIAIWASDAFAPHIVGMRLTSPHPGPLVRMESDTRSALAGRQPIQGAHVTIDAAAKVSGEWRLDAAPLFDPLTASFTGYRGCLRRPIIDEQSDGDSEADQMRQVLHELRTPVNAIQGFAEIIQQQLFGAAPHQYRAHAAAISVDSAKLLAGFDEVDRLVKLEAQAMELEAGQADLRSAVSETVQRLQAVLRPRNAGFSLNVSGSDFITALDRSEVMALCWRLLATAAGALGPGEEADIVLTSDGIEIRLELEAPRALAEDGKADPSDKNRQGAVNAGMFGPFFAFRLAQAEAHAAGGFLICKTKRVILVLPALTAHRGTPSARTGRIGGS
ncbi:histidine kinase dimerization/phospho-acceptor domain-containing protein [Erythrobacter alti]|uniref:histidine kinase dimerization/phospho-acceptor domain-containing protein n=1 Tax=Erythrobacter alti TaxID=1896145 RepID=UPI0030F493DA